MYEKKKKKKKKKKFKKVHLLRVIRGCIASGVKALNVKMNYVWVKFALIRSFETHLSLSRSI